MTLSNPITVLVYIGKSYWKSEMDQISNLNVMFRDVTGSISHFLSPYQYHDLRPSVLFPKYFILDANTTAFTQESLESTLAYWTESGVLPGYMQKNYVRKLYR